MKPVSESDSVAAVRGALEPYRKLPWDQVHYLWEAVGEKVRWDDKGANAFASKEECVLVFDPNPWNMPARLEVGRLAKCDGAPLAYRCSREDVRGFLSQRWVSNADFYVLSVDGVLPGLRSHEDPDSATGMWLPK